MSFLCRSKRFAGLGIFVTLAVTGFLSLTATGYEMALQTRQEYKYFSETLHQDVNTKSNITFVDGVQPDGREFSSVDGEEISKFLSEAWAKLAVANTSGDQRFIQDHFDTTALKKAQARLSNKPGMPEQGYIVLAQTISPRFFHSDGSIFEATSDDTLTVRYEFEPKGETINFLSVSRDCTRQILILRSIGWKIRNHELDCSNPITLTSENRHLRPLGLPLKGINYYPADTPWDEFWKIFDAQTIEDDMKWMASLGANSIRIFIPYEYFSNIETGRDALARLDHFLYLAKQFNISVMPTLFDFRGTYVSSGWAEDYHYLTKVVEVLVQHENVQVVDLKNEPDLDYAYHDRALVDAWLITFSTLLREIAPELSVTIGWLNHENAIRNAGLVDVVSYHEYGKQSDAARVYEAARQAIPNKPVLITETGKPSWSVVMDLPFSNASQADWLKMQLTQLNDADGVFVWTLHDFSYEDTAKVARLPWRRAFQASFGLIDRSGKPKPSAQVFKEFKFLPGWNTAGL